MSRKLKIVSPAGTPASLRAALRAGADAVYLGLRDTTNARNFPGLNFSTDELAAGVALAHEQGAKVLLAVNTYMRASNPAPWFRAVDIGADCGVDAVILADTGLLDYAARRHPDLRRHLSVQASAATPEAIRFYTEQFGVKRVVLPRVLTVTDIADLISKVNVETEVFAFGGLCVMAEGRCALSGHVTGASPNCAGVCSPASHARFETSDRQTRFSLGDVTLDIVPDNEARGYPTPCKGRYLIGGEPTCAFAEPGSLNVLPILPDLAAAGVTAVKIEGRQRGRAYVEVVTRAFRRAVDALADGQPIPEGLQGDMTEGGRTTGGSYERGWR